MDIGKSFSFMFEDQNWIKKFFIGVVVMFIPIINFASFGYMVQLVTNIREGIDQPLPDWDEFGKYFMDGIKLWLGMLVYFIPFIVIMFIYFAVTMVAVLVAESGGGGEEMMGMMMAASMLCLMPLMIIFGILPTLLLPAMMINYSKYNEISAVFRFGEVWGIAKADLGNYVIMLLIAFVASQFIAPLGLILCFVGMFFTLWWSYLLIAHISGQYAVANNI